MKIGSKVLYDESGYYMKHKLLIQEYNLYILFYFNIYIYISIYIFIRICIIIYV